MIGVYAMTDIAFMKYTKIFSYLALCQFIRNSVGRSIFTRIVFPRTNHDFAVTMAVECRHPQPTFSSFFYFAPKSFHFARYTIWPVNYQASSLGLLRIQNGPHRSIHFWHYHSLTGNFLQGS